MIISDLITRLQELKDKHGDLPVLIADRYQHFEVKWIEFSSVSGGDHVCLRLDDDFMYGHLKGGIT
tara:strand:- start:16 stop:213 length:198 start_codon:yes stop_codon:yes gene_type:complete